jgi:ADP-dependent phosphofructokinase/glucokinase
MRIVFNVLFIFYICTSHIYADIDAEIEAIQHASVKERFKLMNAFKKNLIKMKEKERIEAIKKLSKRSKNKHANKVLENLKQSKKRKNIRKHVEYQQIDNDAINSEMDEQEGEDHDD